MMVHSQVCLLCFTASNSIPPGQQLEDGLVVDCGSHHYTNVEDLVTAEHQIKLARIEALWNAHSI